MKTKMTDKLRWGITAGGKLIIACAIKSRAEGIAIMGRQDTKDPAALPIEVVEIDTSPIVINADLLAACEAALQAKARASDVAGLIDKAVQS